MPVGSVRWIPARGALARTGSQRRPTAGRRARQALSPQHQTKAPLCASRPPRGHSELQVLPGGAGGTAEGAFLGFAPPAPCPHPISVHVGEWPQDPSQWVQPSGLPSSQPPSPLRAAPLAQGPVPPQGAPPWLRAPWPHTKASEGFLSHEASVVSHPPGRALSKLPSLTWLGAQAAASGACLPREQSQQTRPPPAAAAGPGHPCSSAPCPHRSCHIPSTPLNEQQHVPSAPTPGGCEPGAWERAESIWV